MRRERFILAFVQFVDVLAFCVLLASLPATARRYGLGLVPAAASVAVVALVALSVSPLLRRTSDRWGRKPVLVATGLLTAEALFVAAWAGDAYMLFVSRAALGVAIADLGVVSAAGADLTRYHGDPPPRPIVAARGYVLGVVGGPMLTLAVRPFGYGAPAYVAAAVAVVALIEIVALFSETKPAEGTGARTAAS